MLKLPPRNEAELGALGILLGRILRDRIPLIHGLKDVSEGKLKQLGAALATTGMINMFRQRNRLKTGEMEQIHVEAEDLETIINDLSTASNVKPDLVFVGCPHCSAKEIAEISRIMEGRRVNTRTEFWVCTSRSVKEKKHRTCQ